MRIENCVFFAPGIEFKELDWSDPRYLIGPFRARVFGFYLEPASYFVNLWNQLLEEKKNLSGLAFGCGVISSTAIDFLAGIEYFPSQDVSDRYKKWLNNRIPVLSAPDPQNSRQAISARFYYEFRNGLVHEGRIKNAGQFSLDPDLFQSNSLFEILDDALAINPAKLLDYIAQGVDAFLAEVEADEFSLQRFRCTLINYFSTDMAYIKKLG